MSKERKQCFKQVFSGERCDMGGHPCTRNATVFANGNWWCGIHSPEAVAARDKAKRERWDKERALEDAKWERLDAEHAACEGVPTEALKPGILKLLMEKKP